MPEFSLPLDAIRSTRIVSPEGVRAGVVRISGGRIAAIDPYDSPTTGLNLLDAGTDAVLPGLVDCHVHFNEPGRTDWEGFESGTRAAAAGGVTFVVEMPLNSIPSTVSVDALTLKRQAAEGKCAVDYAFWGGVVDDDASQVAKLAGAGVAGFKCFLVHPGTEEFQMVTDAHLRTVMPEIASRGLPLLVHAELPGPIARAKTQQGDWLKYETYLSSRPAEAEVEAVRLMIGLSQEFGCRVHIVHLSASEALDDLRKARAEGIPITVETCPHYLCFTSHTIADGATEFKCAPPIREAGNREALWQALRDGEIDLIGSDHSPCPPELKLRGVGHFGRAWGGISSISLGLPAVWTEAQARQFGLNDIVRWMSAEPAKLAGFSDRKGAIRVGCDADLAVFDSECEWTVGKDSLYYRHPISPYVGVRFRGKVRATFLRGEVCFEEGEFRDARGVELTSARGTSPIFV
jgi:allantoinase